MTGSTGMPAMRPIAHRADRSAAPGWGLILLSILGPVAWLCFTLLYVGFWAQGFSLFQSVIVILVSVILLAGVMGGSWAAWGARRHFRMPWPEEE